MELHERVARCFTDAIAEWTKDEEERILSEAPFDRAFSLLHNEIQHKAITDILKRASEKLSKLQA